jgi:enoyl-CoA hydratase
MSNTSFGDYEFINVTTDNPVDGATTVTVDRPDARNALGTTVREELSDAFATAEATDDVRVLVITGSEESGSFVAGADITDFAERTIIEQREASKRPRVYEQADDLEIPVIARINGHALGGGCELAMACDMRLARADAKLGQPEINLSLIPGGGGTQRLPRLVGEGHAMRLTLSGEVIDAPEAKEIGLVDEVYEEDALDDRIAELAGMMAEKSPIALELGKEAVRAAGRMNLDDGIEYEAELFAVAFGTEDKQEGVTAFLEKRDPEFTGQ